MTAKTPSAVVAFENVPADAADPVVDVYVNNVKVNIGGGDDMIVYKLTEDAEYNYDTTLTLKDVADAFDAGKFIVFMTKMVSDDGYGYTPFYIESFSTAGEYKYVVNIRSLDGGVYIARPADMTTALHFVAGE